MKRKLLFMTLMSFTFTNKIKSLNIPLENLINSTFDNITDLIDNIEITNKNFISKIKEDILREENKESINKLLKKGELLLNEFEPEESMQLIEDFIRKGIKGVLDNYEDKLTAETADDNLEDMRYTLIKGINEKLFDENTNNEWCMMIPPRVPNRLTIIPIHHLTSVNETNIIFNASTYYDLTNKTFNLHKLRLIAIPQSLAENNESFSDHEEENHSNSTNLSPTEENKDQSTETTTSTVDDIQKDESKITTENTSINHEEEQETKQEESATSEKQTSTNDESTTSIEKKTDPEEETKNTKENKETPNESEKTFEFTNLNLFHAFWDDFQIERSTILKSVQEKNEPMSYSIPKTYKNFSKLESFISKTMDEVIKGLKTPNRNKILGIEKKTKKTTNEAWTKKIRVAFKELYESLDNNLFYVHWDKGDTTKFDIIHNNDNELRMNILYTLKRISPTKKFQLFIDFNFSKVTQKCSLNEVKLRCVPESKFEQKKPTQK